MAQVAIAKRMPVLCVPHGGGPMPLLDDAAHTQLTKWLTVAAKGFSKPSTILVVSAHWEYIKGRKRELLQQEQLPTLTSGVHPGLLYDYYGFPEEAYQIQYNAPGAPQLANQVAELLKAAGMGCNLDQHRNWDHGVFVPLKLLYPDADVPVLEMSMLKSLNAEEHMKLGEALAPLRDQGVLILGSGLSYHNMQEFRRGRSNANSPNKPSEEFDAYLQDAVANSGHSTQQRRQLLAEWEKGPSARVCHPREEHLLPLMLAAGAALYSPAQVVFSDKLFGAKISGYMWQ